MKNIFNSTGTQWVKYSEYEYKKGADDNLYIAPTAKSKPQIYDPFKNIEEMIIDALNVNRLGKKSSEENLQKNVLDFVAKYGLLGFMTALPTTPDFMDYEAVYFPKNEFISAETMPTNDYIKMFFPFEFPKFQKDTRTAHWYPANDIEMTALALTFADKPLALNIALGRDYCERYDWLKAQLKAWAFTCTGAIMYYEDKDKFDESTLLAYKLGMSAFKGTSPTYHVALFDKPTIVWDFHSLLLGIQMMFSFMLTDEAKPLRICKHCTAIFSATNHNSVFCSPKCKNQHNVYKSRGK